jgi:hypothetical protein
MSSNLHHIDNVDALSAGDRACKTGAIPTLRPENFDHPPRCRRGLPKKPCSQGGRHRAACQRVVRVSAERPRASDDEQDYITAALTSIRSTIPTESKHWDRKVTVPLIEKTTTDRRKDLRQDRLLQHRKSPRTRNWQDDRGGPLK